FQPLQHQLDRTRAALGGGPVFRKHQETSPPMKGMLSLASLAAALVAFLSLASSARAERLYVPLVGGTVDGQPVATSVWIAGDDGASRRVAVRATGKLGAAAATNAPSLMPVDGDASRVSAWLAVPGSDDPVEVPVIGEHDVYAAGSSPALE